MSRTYNYCSADDDTRKLLVKVTDAIKSDTDVEYFIERVDDYIDSKLAFKYNVPFATTPPIIRTISANLSAYYVLVSIYTKYRVGTDDTWMRMFKSEGKGLLDELIRGTLTLIDSSGNKISTRAIYGIRSSTEDFDTTFSELEDTDWEVDSGKK